MIRLSFVSFLENLSESWQTFFGEALQIKSGKWDHTGAAGCTLIIHFSSRLKDKYCDSDLEIRQNVMCHSRSYSAAVVTQRTLSPRVPALLYLLQNWTPVRPDITFFSIQLACFQIYLSYQLRTFVSIWGIFSKWVGGGLQMLQRQEKNSEREGGGGVGGAERWW